MKAPKFGAFFLLLSRLKNVIVKIGIQGIEGSFHDEAAASYFHQNDYEAVSFSGFRELAECVHHGKIDYGVMAIENTIAGTILPNYSLIHDYDLKVSGEVYSRIELSLIAHHGSKIDDIKHVYSHPMALLQCAEFLSKYPHIEVSEHIDTADGVRLIRDDKILDAAAIASNRAATIFDLDVIQKNIETNKANYTRFLITTKRDRNTESIKEKASLRLITGHHPGSLADVLVVFKDFDINLTKIQSIPIVGKPYQYAFNIDVEWKSYDAFSAAVNSLKQSTELIKVLGEYKKGKLPKMS